ncbi:unnamed protein product [Rotaria sordida]|uniref:G-protein coupled receptors family 1 profile domain-containing protein n=1 Tax=Rotaria sordida TaxID=392033 RepID=A0A815WY36_9BILA|nr:unnamed protein product [Rotaria sordida]CAF1551350.1 unnamed protein product [Rotaria sordida]
MMSIYEVALQIRFWSPIILFSIGVPAALLNAIIFVSIKTFRRSSSTYYIVGQSLSDVNVLLILLLQVIPSTSSSVSSIACKLILFFLQLTVSVAMSFLCLSAFDRWACTSQSARIRQLSSIRVAQRVFPIPFILWSLVNIPFLVYCDLVPPIFSCWFTNDLFMRIGILVLSQILTVLLPLIILILFGLLTYRNIRLVIHVRQQPNQSRQSNWEQQMTRMMLIQTLLSIFCTIPRAIFVVYTIFTIDESVTRNFDQLSIIFLVDTLTISIISLNFASSFYIFLLSSPRLRQMIQMHLKCLFNRRNNQVGSTNILLTIPTLSARRTTRVTVRPTVENKPF